jgi:ornithine carbamoyltransferase
MTNDKSMRHLITIRELSKDNVGEIFRIAAELKAKWRQGIREGVLPGRTLGLIFEKPSLRTRVSFETAMIHLGGGSLFLGEDAGFGKRESIADFARVLSSMVDAIVVRAKSHQTVVEMARHATCSVINGLTDEEHPCQALADLFTLQERCGSLARKKLAWVGDGNNVARSLAFACDRTGMQFAMATPPGYEFTKDFQKQLAAGAPQLQWTKGNDPVKAVEGATAVYTDVWASMGQESERATRKRDFGAYQVNAALMRHAPADAVFMHCLPARRGEEVTDDVMDGPQSIIVDQAANRMHVQKGVLAWLLK